MPVELVGAVRPLTAPHPAQGAGNKALEKSKSKFLARHFPKIESSESIHRNTQ